MQSLGLLIEGLVAALMIVTIAYCVVLNRRLIRLKADETALKQTISELVGASEAAERAIVGLRGIAAECDATLGGRLRKAGTVSADLGSQIAAGQALVQRLGQIVEASKAREAAVRPSDAIEAAAMRSALRVAEYRRARAVGNAA